MAKIDLLRKLIREEVAAAIRQELPMILSEHNSASAPYDSKKALQEQVKSKVAKIPGTLNTAGPRTPVKFASNNPMAALLNDTAKSMLNEDFSMTTDEIHPTLAFQPKEDKVGDVQSMLGSARKSSNVDAVQINEVPDFSALMNKMKERGQI
jgi:hypothetical protein